MRTESTHFPNTDPGEPGAWLRAATDLTAAATGPDGLRVARCVRGRWRCGAITPLARVSLRGPARTGARTGAASCGLFAD